MRKSLTLAAVTAALAACGGSGGGEPEPPAAVLEVPASAGANVASFVGYLAALPAEDQREALGVDAVVAPTSETDEPLALQ